MPESKHGHLPLPSVLCVDLDGTLVLTDTLWESLLQILFKKPLAFFPILLSLTQGKARFKSTVARHASLHADSLPYREDLLSYLQEQKSAGRRLALVTAAHQSIADAVATHIQLFEVVLGSSEEVNLSGEEKGRALVRLYGDAAFSYAGNSATDLKVWKHGAAAIPVSAPASVVNRIGIRIEKNFPPQRRTALRTLFNALRIHQWVKNLLALVPIFTAGAFLDLNSMLKGFWAVLALSLAASAQYLLNDLLDLDSDRKHYSKKRRALAACDLPIPLGLLLVPVLLSGTALIAWFQHSWPMLFLVAAYFVASLLYSIYLKTLPLVDVFVLAGLYTGRVIIGGEVTGHPVTTWLLTFSFFWFLSFGFLKRFIEVHRAENTGKPVGRRGYYAGESMILMAMGQGSGFASTVLMALYINSEAANRLYAEPSALWIFVPVGLLIHCRLWLSGFRGHIEEDPVRYVILDRVMWASAVLCGAAYLLALGYPSF
jgi:4-hydroxybenzoate polyprenyltransferase/phosphoserine phosphatase